jgi:hypothetical protein
MKTTNPTTEQKTCLQRAASFKAATYQWFQTQQEITRLMVKRQMVADRILFSEAKQLIEPETIQVLVRQYNDVNYQILKLLNIN